MHAAIRTPEAPPALSGARSWTLAGFAVSRVCPWVAGLLAVVTIPFADGLTAGVVAFERDTTVFYFPLMTWVGQRLRQGEFPLWTPQVFGGYPIFADGEVGLAYPPAVLALWLLSPDRALVALRVAHLWIAALGAFALARAWRLPYPSAALAGIVFALGSFLAAQIHHENIIRTAAWLPVMLAAVEYGLTARSTAHRVRWTLAAAVALGLAGLSLHSQMLAIELMILVAYAAFRWAVGPLTLGSPGGGWAVGPLTLGRLRAGWRGGLLGTLLRGAWLDRLVGVTVVCGPVIVVGLALAAAQLVPLVELAGFSARGSGIPYSESAAYSVTPYGLLQLLFPYVFRGPNNQQWGLWTHWESYLYVGLAPLVLASVALVCVRRREVLGWGLLGLLGLILALGQYSPINLHYLLWLLPGMSSLRAPGRFTIIVVLAAGMLAAYGLAWLQAFTGDRHRLRQLLRWWWTGLAAIVVIGAVIHVSLLVWPGAGLAAIQSAYLVLSRDAYPLTPSGVLTGVLWSTDLLNSNVWRQLIGLAVVLVTVSVAFGRRGAQAGIWPVVLVGMAALDLLLFGWVIHPREPLSRIGAEPSAVQAIERLPSPDAAPNRILSSPVLNQVAADRLAPFGIQEANGYSSLQFIWHRDYLARVQYADDRLLDLWGVRYVVDPARYGQLSSYRGVSFLSSQALLHAPHGSALGEQTYSLGGSMPVAEVRFVSALVGAVEVPQGAPVAKIELLDDAGQPVGSAELVAGRDVMDWSWDQPSARAAIKHERVESAGSTTENGATPPRERQLSFAAFTFDQPIQASQVVVHAVAPTGEFVLYGAAAVAPDGTMAQLFGRTKTKYHQVYSDDEIRVWADTNAMPRAFIVPTAREAPSLGAALSVMVREPFQPDREVVLAHDTGSAAPIGLVRDRGGTGSATVDAYAADSVRVHTSATADAWLVLSDTYYPGWTVTVDGQPSPLLRGDVLFRVVPIPAGEHDVRFTFDPPSVKLGVAISLAALACVLVAWIAAGAGYRPRRTT